MEVARRSSWRKKVQSGALKIHRDAWEGKWEWERASSKKPLPQASPTPSIVQAVLN